MTNDRDINGKTCITTSYLAKLLAVSERTVREWGKNGCPKEDRGWWYLPDVIAWQNGNEKEKEESQPIEYMSLETQKLFHETQLKKAQSEKEELKNAIARGDYLEKAFVVDELQRFFVIFKRSVQGLSNKLSMEVSSYVDAIEARRLENYIGGIVDDALEQFSVSGVYKASKKRIR